MAMLARNFAPAFPVELVDKDLGYLLSQMDRAPVLEATRLRVLELDPRAVYINDFMGLFEVVCEYAHHGKFFIIRAIKTNLRRVDRRRQIGQ